MCFRDVYKLSMFVLVHVILLNLYKQNMFKPNKKSNSFTFSLRKNNANYAESSRVGNLEADFQQFPLV